jgi:hypothetical protein
MAVHSITHTFYDFEIEPVGQGSPEEVHLVKILSVDGRRFTYEVRGGLSEEVVVYVKSLIDAVVFSDLVIEKTDEGFEAREAGKTLKRHS